MHTIAPDAPLYDANGNYTPAPGTEYPFSVSDIARATARLLGDGWTVESGAWGVSGKITGPYITDFTLVIDYEGDLCIDFDARYGDDALPENPELPEGVKDGTEGGVYLHLACAADGLDTLAERAAAAIRAVTGR
ncbi:hypothetical protein [Streptomyces chartreusis]|uniref:hypothetical protein n=1 Tax=Streptomyces chartreusis TaxID=1969 RepID=UPI00365DCCCE